MIKNLETFIAVARLLNFGAAARSLNYSQSTVSEQIKSLEEYLGVRVFERIGRKVFLTEQGKKLVSYAERMVRDAENLQNLFKAKEKVSGTMVIGAAETLCTYWLPPLLKEYRSLYPAVQITIRVGICTEFPQWLQQNAVDTAFSLFNDYDEPQLRKHTLFTDETVLFAAPDHPLSTLNEIVLSNLAGQTLLMPEGASGYPMDLKLLLERDGVKTNIMEFSSLESIKQCVKNGLGVSLLPEMTVKEEVERGELVILRWKSSIKVKGQMLFHQDKWMSPPLVALEGLVRSKV